jgi:hypothetical protein
VSNTYANFKEKIKNGYLSGFIQICELGGGRRRRVIDVNLLAALSTD